MSAYARPFPVDASMTAIAIAYRNRAQDMIHSKVLPTVRVLSEEFRWLDFSVEQYFTQRDLEVGRKGRVNEVEFHAEEKRGYVRDFGLDDVVPITDIDEAGRARTEKRGTYDPQAAAVEGLTALVDLGGEVRAASVVQDVNNYDAERRLVLADEEDQFSDYVNSDPYALLSEGMTKPLVYRANTIAMGQPVWDVLKMHPKLIKAAKGNVNADGAVSRAQFAELMEIELDRLLIGASMVNAARPGQPVNLTKVWGNSIEFLYIDQKSSPTDAILTWGFTADLEGRIAGAIHDPNVGLKGGMRVRVGERVNEIVCAKSLGYIIKNAI